MKRSVRIKLQTIPAVNTVTAIYSNNLDFFPHLDENSSGSPDIMTFSRRGSERLSPRG